MCNKPHLRKQVLDADKSIATFQCLRGTQDDPLGYMIQFKAKMMFMTISATRNKLGAATGGVGILLNTM